MEKKAIFYLTSNGVVNNNNGIGTQTQTFLTGLLINKKKFFKKYGKFEVHIVTPNKTDYKIINNDLINENQKIITAFNGKIHYCDNKSKYSEFWNIDCWEFISNEAAKIILKYENVYDKILVIAVDPPFLHVPKFLEARKNNDKIFSLVVLYTSSYIHDKNNINSSRLYWETEGVKAINNYENVFMGEVCEFLKKHYNEKYFVNINKFLPYKSSLNLDHNDFSRASKKDINYIIEKYKIPREKNLLLAFGRANWIKGFDIILSNLDNIEKEYYLILIVTPFSQNDSILSEYRALIKQNIMNVLLLTEFNREIPKILCQYKKTKVVICPSRGEPFSNIPFEVSLWAKNSGPVLLCSNIDGFLEQIDNESNGFLFNIEEENDLGEKINKILSYDKKKICKIRKKAYTEVISERNFYNNFCETLDFFFKQK